MCSCAASVSPGQLIEGTLMLLMNGGMRTAIYWPQQPLHTVSTKHHVTMIYSQTQT